MTAVTTRGHCGTIPIGMGISGEPHLFDRRIVRLLLDQPGGPRFTVRQHLAESGGRPTGRAWDWTAHADFGKGNLEGSRTFGSVLGRLDRYALTGRRAALGSKCCPPQR